MAIGGVAAPESADRSRAPRALRRTHRARGARTLETEKSNSRLVSRSAQPRHARLHPRSAQRAVSRSPRRAGRRRSRRGQRFLHAQHDASEILDQERRNSYSRFAAASVSPTRTGHRKTPGVPIENRFFTGGGNSVRGFKENSLGPTAIVEQSDGDPVETVDRRPPSRWWATPRFVFRFRISRATGFRPRSSPTRETSGRAWGASTSRTSGLYASNDDVTEDDFRYSIGVGLRYNTPVGPIRLDYGMPIKKDDTDRFGRFHLSLGQIF